MKSVPKSEIGNLNFRNTLPMQVSYEASQCKKFVKLLRKIVKFLIHLAHFQKRAVKSIKYCVLIAVTLVAGVQIGCVTGNALRTAEKLAAEKDYRGALEAYQTVVDTKPGTPEALKAQVAIGELLIEQMKQPAEGIKTYEAVIAAAP